MGVGDVFSVGSELEQTDESTEARAAVKGEVRLNQLKLDHLDLKFPPVLLELINGLQYFSSIPRGVE